MKPALTTEKVLATLDPREYSMERKYDGHRVIVRLNGSVSMWTRDMRKIDVPTNLEDDLVRMGLPVGTVLDGEIWNPTKRGDWKSSPSVRCCLVLWDVVQREGRSLAAEPLTKRREILHWMAGGWTDSVRTALVEPLDLKKIEEIHQDAVSFRQENAVRSGYVHGVVVKRNASPRRDHATRCREHSDWLKLLFPGMKGWEPG